MQVNGGILIHGPPGTGKSFFARAIGNVWSRADKNLKKSFIRGPELFNELVGKTEESVRLLFKDAINNLEDFEAGNSALV